MIPTGAGRDQHGLAAALTYDALLQRYRAFFALLDWRQVPERVTDRAWPGPAPHPEAAYVKAVLVKLCEQKPFVTDLRDFLLEHPLLVLELGFTVVAPQTTHPGQYHPGCPAARDCPRLAGRDPGLG